MQINFVKSEIPDEGTLVIGTTESEELSGHLDQFTIMLKEKEFKPIGRTLDFLTQEMLREANTIASKCNDAEISRWCVEVKGAIDRIKEQVQNVE